MRNFKIAIGIIFSLFGFIAFIASFSVQTTYNLQGLAVNLMVFSVGVGYGLQATDEYDKKDELKRIEKEVKNNEINRKISRV